MAEAAAAGPRLGEAFLSSIGRWPPSLTSATTLKLVQSLAQPYPNNAEAQFAIALAAYNTGLTDFESSTVAMQAIDRALVLKPGWEQAILLKVEILEQAVDGSRRGLSGRGPEDRAGREAVNSALVQVRIQQKRYARSRRDPAKLWEEDQGNREYEFGMAMLAMQTKDWASAETPARGTEARRTTATTASSSPTSRRSPRRLAATSSRSSGSSAVPDGERGWFAKLRAAAMLGKLGRLDEARSYLAELPAVTRRAAGPGAAGRERSSSRCRQQQGGLRDPRRARSPSIPTTRPAATTLAMVAEKLDKIDVVERSSRG